MALSARLETLKSKHLTLEEDIKRELRHPLPDTVKIAALKKQKLQIKDTLTSLQSA